MSNRLRDIATVLAVFLAAVALGAVVRPQGSQQDAVDAIRVQCSQVLADERSRFSDALRLLQNLGAAVEPVLTEEQAADPAVAEAIEQAKYRIKEWSQ